MQNEYRRIRRFHTLTSMTYELALLSVDKDANNKDTSMILKPVSPKMVPFSAADRKIKNVKLVRGWVTLEEYAKLSNLSFDEVEAKADKGELGDVKEWEGKRNVFWSREDYGGKEIPPIDSPNAYQIEFKVSGIANLELKQPTVEDIIQYLRHSDKLEKRTSEATILLNRETFLLYWTAFEQYVKKFTFTLFELFPEQVFAKKYGKNLMSYKEIYISSAGFTNLQNLKEAIFYSIADDPGIEREAISKQLNFIKECYLGKNKSPYDSWYILKGERKEINYQILDQLRLIRNALVHNNGIMTEDWEKINIINRPDDKRIIVNDDLLLKTELIIKSLSYNLYELISES